MRDLLRLSLFGGVSLTAADGSPVVIASRKCRALLAYLALQRRPSPRERVARLLWEQAGEAQARASLRQGLSVLRREVPGGGPWLEATAEEVGVNHDLLAVDVIEAERLLAAGESERALALCARGPLLEGLSFGGLELDEWCDGQRRIWRERETGALAGLMERARAAADPAALLPLARRLLALEPWNEEGHREVMRALAALGRYSEALRQYQLAAEILRRELGLAPGAETERLQLEIRARRTAALTTPAAGVVSAGGGGDSGSASAAVGMSAPEPASDSSGNRQRPGAPTFSGPATAGDTSEAPAAASIVGRQLELGQVDALLEGCRRSGRGHVILIRGEAGLGKTVFLQETLSRAAAAGYLTHLVQPGEYGGGHSTEVMRELVAALSADAESGELGLEHRLALDELLDRPLDAEEAALAAALDPEARTGAHTRALETLLARAAARRPRVVAVDDLHWCDQETVRLLCALATAAPQHRTVVVFACRSGEEPSDLAWTALTRRGSLTSFDLGPLAPEEAERLAAGFATGDPEARRRCLARAGGHPLFLVQLLASEAAGDAIPGSLQAAVVARLGRVTTAERRLLEAAAVLGGAFTPADLAQLLGEEPPDPTGLVRRGWLTPRGPRLAVAHDLLAAAIRATLDPAARARLHRRAAEWLADRDPLASAGHLDRAGDAGAGRAYLSVAREALQAHRLDLAEEVLQRADACPTDADLAFEAACLQGDLRLERGDAAGAHAVFGRAGGQARSPEQQVRAQLGLHRALRLLDRREEALAGLARLEPLIPADDHTTRAHLEHLRGNLLFVAGEVAACRAAHERALTHARRAESPIEEAQAESGLGDAHYLAGRMLSSLAAFQRCRELARAHGDLRMEAASEYMLAIVGIYTTGPAAVTASAARARELAARIDDPRLICLAEIASAAVSREGGAFVESLRHAEAARRAARRLGAERLEANCLEAMARAHLDQGERDTARSLCRQAFTLCQRSGGRAYMGGSILALLAEAEAESDPAASARALADAEAVLAEGGTHCHNHFDVHEIGTMLALGRRDWAGARRHLEALEHYQGEEVAARQSLFSAHARAVLDLLDGDGASDRGPVDVEVALAAWPGRAEAAGQVKLGRDFAALARRLAAG